MMSIKLEDHYCFSSPSSSSSSSSSSSRDPMAVPRPRQTQKRKAGRKKFRETRHPVFHGVRERNGGKWVCEIREPLKKTRIWLGTYQIPEMAARAHDVAAIALRGKYAALNFADSVWLLPRACSNSAADIRSAATQAATMFRPLSSPSPSSSSPKPLPWTNKQQTKMKKSEGSAVVMTQSPPPQPTQPSNNLNANATTGGFVDEEELFDMHGLLRYMAEGLLLAPPQMKHELDWDDEQCDTSFSLWTDV